MGRRGWIFSSVLHVSVVVAAVLGLPSLFDGNSEVVEESIVVSMIAEEDVAGIRQREPEPKLEEASEPEPELELEPLVEEVSEPELEPVKAKDLELRPLEPEPIEVKMPEPPPPPEPEYAAVEPKLLPEPKPEVLPEPKLVVEEKLPEPPLPKPESKSEPELEPFPKPLAQVPRPVVKPKPSFDSLLKSVAKEEIEPEPRSEPEPAFDRLLASVAVEPAPKVHEPDRPRPVRSMSPALSNQIAAVIKDRVEANWSVPAGVRDAGDLVVNIRIRLGRDGAVQSADILDADYAADSNFRTMAESARRAVQKASPIKALRRFGDDYNEWRDVTMTFRPPV